MVTLQSVCGFNAPSDYEYICCSKNKKCLFKLGAYLMENHITDYEILPIPNSELFALGGKINDAVPVLDLVDLCVGYLRGYEDAASVWSKLVEDLKSRI